MRIVTFLLLAFCVHVSAKTSSQTITLSGKNLPLKKIFSAIEAQTGYFIFTNRTLLEKTKPISVDAHNMPLKSFLQMTLSDQPFDYEIKDNTIILSLKPAPAPLKNAEPLLEMALITGRVTATDGSPLSGANVMIRGTKTGTTTNSRGEFELNAAPGATLVITSVGYLQREIIAGKDKMFITLETSTSELDETVIVAYGSTTKRLNTGNVGTVKAADIEKQPVTNPLLALQGRVAGLFITQASGLPNSTVQVKIRGTNTIAQQTNPLYVIDGLPYSPNTLLNVGFSGSGQSSPFSFLNPSSIESIDVLKDADATAIYGSRGANGVILITLKQGKTGATKFDLNVYSGMSKVPRKLDLMNGEEFLAMRREAYANDGTPIPSGAVDLLNWDQQRNVNWQERLIGESTLTTDAQLSMSGGSGNTRYRVSGGYNRNTPPFPGSFNSQKVSGGITLSTASENKRFNASFGVNYLSDQTYLPVYDPITKLTLSPNAPEPFNEDGSLNFKDYRSSNPFSGFKNWYRGKTNNLISNMSMSYIISRALTFRVTGGYNNMVVNGISATTIAEKAGNPDYPNPTGISQFSYNTTSSWIAEPQLSYHGRFAAGTWEVLAGSTFQGGKANGQLITGNGYTNDGLLNSLAAASTITKGTSTYDENRFTSLYGRLNYNYQDKYLVNLTGRRDGSSRFGPGKKFGNFGAAGMAWIFSKEAFMDRFPVLSFGKLRASYGLTGNEPGANYQYLALNSFSSPGRPYQGISVVTPDNLLSPYYAWEEVKKLEAALELGFFKDRLLLTVSYFRNRSSNQLINYTLPDITGFARVLLNQNALVQNSGFEYTFSTVNVKSSRFIWKSEFNLSVSKNKLIEFPGIENTSYATSLFIGKPLSTLPYYRAAGVDPATGVYQYYTSDGKLTFDPDYIKDPTEKISFDPAFFGGLQNSFTYKQFSLDLFFQFVKQKGQNYIYQYSSDPAGSSSMGSNNQPKALLDRWQKPGDIATYQKYSAGYGAASNALFYQRQSDAAVVDASYIRLKNVSLSYELPAGINRKLHLERARIYCHAQNLLTFSSYNGLDPESQTYLPPLSIWTVGAQITF